MVLPTATIAPLSEAKVYISGAVRNPGVYDVPEGGRLVEAVELAGGATEEADLTSVNLAVRVKGQDHWHIPTLGESVGAPSAQGAAGTARIDINSATAEELERLPSIGEVKARSIIRHRETSGPFSSVEDLLEVLGIGPATLDAFRDLVEVR